MEQRLRDVLGFHLGDGTAQIVKTVLARTRAGRAVVAVRTSRWLSLKLCCSVIPPSPPILMIDSANAPVRLLPPSRGKALTCLRLRAF